jgi:hypothetical protein
LPFFAFAALGTVKVSAARIRPSPAQMDPSYGRPVSIALD